MFFRHLALSALLLSCGCVGRTILEDPAQEVVPAGTKQILERSFDPALNDFVGSLTFSTFEDRDCGYSGYYCPGLGVKIARKQVGRSEFETSVVHEVLHAIYFHDLVDTVRFAEALERLQADPDFQDFVPEATADGWQGLIYILFERSEYFARVGDEIVRRRGLNVPDYLWDIYRGILHPRIEQQGRRHATSPIPDHADVQFSDDTIHRRRLIPHALGLRSVYDTILPRRDVVGFAPELNIDVDEALQPPLLVLFRTLSTNKLITSCSAMTVNAGKSRRPRCFWNPVQARDILNGWLDYDLAIEIVDPTLAMNRR